jgi:hypothetical protein
MPASYQNLKNPGIQADFGIRHRQLDGLLADALLDEFLAAHGPLSDAAKRRSAQGGIWKKQEAAGSWRG